MRLLKKLTFIFAIFSLFIILIFFHIKGIIFYDEGYILHSALRVVHGEAPYRDFDFVYTPFSIVAVSAFLKLFGESVFSERLAALTVSLLSLLALYKILSLITKSKLLVIVSMLFFISWGPAHINFAWPTMFAASFYLLTLLLFLLGYLKKNKKYFLWAGVAAVLVLASKQNFGAGAILATCLSFFLIKINNKTMYIRHYLFGIAALSSLVLLVMVFTSSLVPFIHNMDLYTIKRILVGKVLDTPFIYEGSLWVKFGKLIFYISPLIFSLLAFYFVNNSKKKVFSIIPIFIIIFYLLGVRPTTDYTHTVPLFSLSVLSLVLIITFANNLAVKRGFVFLLIFLVGFGFYKAYYGGYYRWEQPLSENIHFSTNPRVKLYLTHQVAGELGELVKYTTTYTKPNELIYIHYYSPLIYFVADRKNAIRYDYISLSDIPLSSQKLARDQLEKKNVKFVIIHNINKMERSLVAEYIRKQYRVKKVIGDYIILMR